MDGHSRSILSPCTLPCILVCPSPPPPPLPPPQHTGSTDRTPRTAAAAAAAASGEDLSVVRHRAAARACAPELALGSRGSPAVGGPGAGTWPDGVPSQRAHLARGRLAAAGSQAASHIRQTSKDSNAILGSACPGRGGRGSEAAADAGGQRGGRLRNRQCVAGLGAWNDSAGRHLQAVGRSMS